jgi:hypothetical protein
MGQNAGSDRAAATSSLRRWEPVALRRLGTFGDALVGGSMVPGSADTGKVGDKGVG